MIVSDSFFVFNNERAPGNFMPSIRDMEKMRHYKIHMLDVEGFFLPAD